MRKPTKRGDAEISRRIAEKKTDWNMAYPKRTSCSEVDIEWEGLLVERAYRMDLVVDDRVVVEAKTVEKLVDAHFAQVNSQLRFSGFEVGLLLNFRQWPLKEGIRRVVHTRS